ncbi:MAG: 2-phospho-L-lactate transferase [Actinomycetota bacterium]
MKVVELSGGVGGARMARGLAAVPEVDLTVIVNVGDDASNHGLHISPDLDTVVYTLAGVEGPRGWGRADDTFTLNNELGRFGVDNTFQLGDRDLALKLFRTNELANGARLSDVTARIARAFDVSPTVLPASDEPLRTMVRTADGWLTFQEYFVKRGHRDEVVELRFDGAEDAAPAPGVLEAIRDADMVIIGPSNPPLSIWPILEIGDVRSAVATHPSVTAISPLIGGKTVKGPADRVMTSLGLPPGNRGVAVAYEGIVHRLVIDPSDGDDASSMGDIEVLVTPTLIKEPEAAARLAAELVGL